MWRREGEGEEEKGPHHCHVQAPVYQLHPLNSSVNQRTFEENESLLQVSHAGSRNTLPFLKPWHN
jgi:hypothetical protein